MKRCPTCDKTFDDNLKFCQIDGTSLVEDAPVDPYKTMVASKEDIAAAMASLTADEPKEPEEPVLEIPSSIDANVTQVVSEAELRAEMDKMGSADNQVIDVPPIAEPEPPKFSEPILSAPSFGEPAPPPSPFSTGGESKPADEFSMTSPPIPSPFGEPKPPSMEPSTPFEHEYSAPEEPTPPTPQFAEPEPAYNPFEHSAPVASEPLAQAELTAPAASDTNMQNPQNFGQTPAPVAGGSVNQTLPIVSLVFGILSLCCYISPLTGIIALITGFMGMKNANNDPVQYGGKTLAIVGMILGGLFLLIGLAYWVFLLFFGGLSMMMNMANQ